MFILDFLNSLAKELFNILAKELIIMLLIIVAVITPLTIVWFHFFDIAGTYRTAYKENGYTITFNRNSTVTRTDLTSDAGEMAGTYHWGFGKLKVTIYGKEKPIEETWMYKLRGDVLILNDDMLLKE